eukprot:GHVS01081147.1.p1 GENE.GHVS01081147.1~~GHVS01081147.1.p1  ORF type:complete len:224 (+),score=27.03 GHVS01081147.1:71-673(+)
MACVNRIVYGRSNAVAVLLAVAAVVLLSISHSRACQSSIDNPKGCEADAPQNGVKMTTTECIEMTQAQSSEGEYAESSEGEYGESDRSEPEDLVIEAAARALASEYVVEGPSYVSCGHLPCENGGGLTVAAVNRLQEGKGDEKQVPRFLARYMHTWSTRCNTINDSVNNAESGRSEAEDAMIEETTTSLDSDDFDELAHY